MRFLTIVAVVVFIGLQYTYWLGPSGYFEVEELARRVEQQARMNTVLEERNRVLVTEIEAFKDKTLDAVEARARTDLGMVAENETFYLVDESVRER